MPPTSKKREGDTTPVSGSTLPPALLRKLPTIADGSDPLAQRILHLLALHPALAVDFRADAVSALTTEDKKALLADINESLGIKPIKPA